MKIIVVGSSGSGKTTFSNKLNERMNSPILHLDSLWHTTDYSKEASEWFKKKQEEFMQNEEWLIDGNYRATMPARLEQADTIIWLKVSKPVAIFRVLRRSLLFRFNRESRNEMPTQFKEKIDKDYLDFLLFVWRYSDSSLATTIERHRQKEAKVIVLKTTREKEIFLKNWKEKKEK